MRLTSGFRASGRAPAPRHTSALLAAGICIGIVLLFSGELFAGGAIAGGERGCTGQKGPNADPSLVTLLALRAAGHGAGESLPESSAIDISGDWCRCFARYSSSRFEGKRWKDLLQDVFEGLPASQGLPLLILSNVDRFSGDSFPALSDRVTDGDYLLFLPRRELLGDIDEFLYDLCNLMGRAFEERVGSAPFKELAFEYRVLHDLLLPIVYGSGGRREPATKNPRKQLVFDFRLLQRLKVINDALFSLLQRKSLVDWELAWKTRDEIIGVQQQMADIIDDGHIVVREDLKERLDSYLSRFRQYLVREVRRRRRKLAAALSRNDIEAARSIIHGILYELKPAVDGILPGRSERSLYDDLCRIHKQYIAPRTRERSLAFTTYFNRLASLLSPPSQKDNYRLGFKISDVEFQFLKRTGSLVLHTDCSGFIGRIYRELARTAGLDMKNFVVHDSGVIGSIYMIEPKVSSKLRLPDGPNPFSVMRQGDFFYFERKIRGKRQRHVVFFDRIVYGKKSGGKAAKEGAGQLVSLWEASPGGVKHRVKPSYWILRWVRSPYGRPRSGAYRLNEMDRIDGILERRGFLF